MKGRTAIEPQPWWQVGLATLLGLIALTERAASLVGLDARWNFLLLPIMIVLSASSVLWVAVRRGVFGVAAWGLIPLGLLAAMGLSEVTGTRSAYLVLVAAGLLLVKHSRLCAGLLVLAGGILPVSSHIEPAVFLWDSPFWNTFSDVSLTLLFFILTPIWVLRVRSIYGQVAGLLLPIAVYFVAVVSALSAARGFSIAKSASIANPALILFAVVAAAVVLYATVSSRLTTGEMGPGAE